MLYITDWTDTSRETVNVKYIELGGRKNERKFMALALAAAMTVSMTSAVFAADEIKSADDLEGKKIGCTWNNR